MYKANEAKKIVADALSDCGIEYTKLKTKTVSFQDLGRGSKVFVKPEGMELPDPRIKDVRSNLPKGVILETPDVVS